jgi:hypothetical protein
MFESEKIRIVTNSKIDPKVRQRDIDAGIIDSGRRLFYCGPCDFPLREHLSRPKQEQLLSLQ